MSSNVYNACAIILEIGALAALGLAAAYLVAVIVGWKGPYRKRRLVRFALCLAACPVFAATLYSLLFFVFLPSAARDNRKIIQEHRDAGAVVHTGDLAPSFTLTNTEERKFAFDDYRGKVVLVNFFATWCGPCLRELPHMQEIWETHRDNDGFALVVIGREETTETLNAFRSKHGYTFPMAPDPERSAYSLFATELIPRTYLISADGTICFEAAGFDEADIATLKAEIVKQLGGTP